MTKFKNTSDKINLNKIFKRTFIYFFPVFIFSVAILVFLYDTSRTSEISSYLTSEKEIIKLQKQNILQLFDLIVSDLFILADNPDLLEMINEGKNYNIHIAAEFKTISANRLIYDQIRFLDSTGMEKIRINFDDKSPYIVPDNKLQNKKDRYYFADAFILEKNEIYMSQFDLNIERGEIETLNKKLYDPTNIFYKISWRKYKNNNYVKPMIRFATPVFDDNKHKKGIILLNYFGAHLLNMIEDIAKNSKGLLHLVDNSGALIKSPDLINDWSFMDKNIKIKHFSDFHPAAWTEIHNNESGQLILNEGLYTFSTIYPISREIRNYANLLQSEINQPAQNADNYYLKLISFLPADVIFGHSKILLNWIFWFYLLFLIILTFSCWLLASNQIKKATAVEQMKNLSQAVEQNPASIVITDQNGTIEYVNPKFEDVTGYNLKEAIGENPRILKSGKQSDTYYKQMWNTINAGSLWKGEFYNKKKNGEEYIELASISPIYDEQKKISHYVAVKEDITDRKKMEEDLRENEEKFRRIFEYSNDAIFIIDYANDTLINANSTAAGILGYENIKELMGSSISTIHCDELGKMHEFMKIVTNKGFGFTDRLTCMRKDSIKIPVEVSASAVNIQNSQYIIASVRDVSKRKKAEEKVLEYTRKIEQDLEEKEKTLGKARILQKNLIQNNLPNIQDINIISAFMPCEELGGDFFIIREGIRENKIIIVIGDCTDHGVRSSMDASLIKIISEKHLSLLFENNETNIYLEMVNQSFTEYADEDQFPTMFACILDIETKILYYSNANSELPFIINKNKVKKIDRVSGMHIGFEKNQKYERKAIHLKPGDKLLFYSDAIIEIPIANHQQLGYDNIKKLLKNFNNGIITDLDYIMHELYNINGSFPLSDDTTLILLEYITKPQKTISVQNENDISKIGSEIKEKLDYLNYSKFDTSQLIKKVNQILNKLINSKNASNEKINIIYSLNCEDAKIFIHSNLITAEDFLDNDNINIITEVKGNEITLSKPRTIPHTFFPSPGKLFPLKN